MATSLRHLILISLLLQSILFIKVISDDDKEGDLLRGIKSYRATLNLAPLTKNEQAQCFSEKMADEFKDQPCTNSSGPDTVPGTETNFKDYQNLLGKCKLNVTTTSGGAILPACVPGLDRALLLSNYTQSQYSRYLNDSKYTGIGIASEDDWVVVILTTSTPDGNYAPDTSSAILVSKIGLIICHTLLLVSLVMLLTSI